MPSDTKQNRICVFVDGDSLQYFAKEKFSTELDASDICSLVTQYVSKAFKVDYYMDVHNKSGENFVKSLQRGGIRVHVTDLTDPIVLAYREKSEEHLVQDAITILPSLKHLVVMCGHLDSGFIYLMAAAKKSGCKTTLFTFSQKKASKKLLSVVDQFINIEHAWTSRNKMMTEPEERREQMRGQATDVAILFALQEEFDYFFPTIQHRYTPDEDAKTGRTFLLFEQETHTGAPYRCVTSFVGTMGAQDVEYVTKMCLDRYRSRTIVLIGIAGSLDADVLVTDVVVGDAVHDYLQDGRLEDHRFVPAGRNYRPHTRLHNVIRFLRYNHPDIWRELSIESREEVARALKGKTLNEELCSIIRTNGFECTAGHIASGPVVGASQEFVKWLKNHSDRKYKALEMESAGVMNAVYQGAGDERVLIVRAISDVSDERKPKLDQIGGGVLRAAAMHNGIRLVESLFRIGAFERADTDGEGLGIDIHINP